MTTDPAEELTAARCREVAGVLRAQLDALDVKLPPSSPLARLLADVAWMASFEGPPLDDVSGASGADEDRAVGAVLRFLQLQDLAAALAALGPVARDNPEALRALRKRFDRIDTQQADAQNRLFELEVAGRLARRGIRPEFGEPDIVARSVGLGRFCLACKRPQNLDRLRERIREGADQIAKRGVKGFVVLDLQPMIFKNDDPVRRSRFYVLQGAAQLAEELAADMDGWIAVVSDAVAQARRKNHVAGVVFAATGWGLTETSPRPLYGWAWVTRTAIPTSPLERKVCRLLGGVVL